MKKVVFLDRDGTLNVDTGYVHTVAQYEVLPGVIQGLKQLRAAGFSLVVLTNQSGIARGLYTEDDYRIFTEYMLRDMAGNGIIIDDVLYCPHHPTEGVGEYRMDCDCRKPKSGMVREAERRCGPFNYAHAWVVGDSERDMVAVKNYDTRVRGILVPKNMNEKEMSFEKGSADYTVSTVHDAVQIILDQDSKK